MATIIKETLVCDITGDEAVESFDFSIGETAYHIDLSDVKAKEFHEALLPFVSAATILKRNRRRNGGQAKRSNAAVIREWARTNGIPVPDRGRIPAEVREQYDAAQK